MRSVLQWSHERVYVHALINCLRRDCSRRVATVIMITQTLFVLVPELLLTILMFFHLIRCRTRYRDLLDFLVVIVAIILAFNLLLNLLHLLGLSLPLFFAHFGVTSEQFIVRLSVTST